MGKVQYTFENVMHDPEFLDWVKDSLENDPTFFPDQHQVGGEHYQKAIQPWEYMEAIMSEEQFTGYLWGNVIKYMSRWEDKGGKQDLEKAQHYLSKMLDHV
jgi:hypothetical protein